jgi:amino acid permease
VLIALSKGGACPDSAPIWTNGNFVFIMVLIVFVIPLSVLKRLDFLGFTSGIAMILMGIFSVVVACYSFIVDCETIGDGEVELDNGTCTTFAEITAENAGHEYEKFQEAVNQTIPDICDLQITTDLTRFKAITAFPIILFAMMCQESVLTIYDELQFQSRDVLMKIAKISFLMIFVIYSTVAFFGYKTWGGYTISEVLIMYTINFADSPWIILARICSLTCVILSTPLLHFPNRRALLILIFGENSEFSWAKWIGAMIFSFTIVIVCVVWFAQSLGQMFAYAGIVTANSLMLILPALFYYKLEDNPERATRKKVSLGVVIFSVLFLIVNFILQVGQDSGLL